MDRKLEYPEMERRQDLLSLAIRQCSEGIAMVDLEGNLLYVNEAFAEMHGYAVKDILGKHFSIFHTAEQMLSVDAANQQIKEKSFFKGEIWHKRRDGSVFPSMMHNSVVKNDNGKPIALLGTMRDISEQRRAEEALIESEEWHRAFLNDLADVVFETDDSGKITYANKASEEITGVPLKDIVGKSFLPLFEENSKKIAIDVYQRTLKGENPEYELTFINGKIARFKNKPRRDKAGQIIGVFGTARDITEQALAEKKYRLLADNVTDIICIINLDKFEFEYISPSVESVLGYTAEEFMDFNVYDLLIPDSADQAMEVVAQEIEKEKYGKAEPQLLDLEVVNKDGLNTWIGLSARFLRDNDGHATSVLCVARDITERKKIEKELLEAKSALEEKVKERTAELNEKNITLKVLLEQRQEERSQMEEVIISNVERLVMPNINRLKNSTLSSKQQTALNILEANLNEIISPFSKTIDSKYMTLTPTEIQVANYIKHGASSKDISESLALSQRTVDTHRYNIRKKLGISGKRANLRTYLSSL